MNPSKIYACILIFSGVNALAGLWYCNFCFIFKFIISILILLSVYSSLMRYALNRHPRAVIGIRYHTGAWFLETKKGEQCAAELQQLLLINKNVVMARFLIQNNNNKTQVLFIFRDSIDSSELHSLLLIARISC